MDVIIRGAQYARTLIVCSKGSTIRKHGTNTQARGVSTRRPSFHYHDSGLGTVDEHYHGETLMSSLVCTLLSHFQRLMKFVSSPYPLDRLSLQEPRSSRHWLSAGLRSYLIPLDPKSGLQSVYVQASHFSCKATGT